MSHEFIDTLVLILFLFGPAERTPPTALGDLYREWNTSRVTMGCEAKVGKHKPGEYITQEEVRALLRCATVKGRERERMRGEP